MSQRGSGLRLLSIVASDYDRYDSKQQRDDSSRRPQSSSHWRDQQQQPWGAGGGYDYDTYNNDGNQYDDPYGPPDPHVGGAGAYGNLAKNEDQGPDLDTQYYNPEELDGLGVRGEPRDRYDIVKAYMVSPLSKVIVAVSAAISCSLICGLVVKMLFGKSPLFVPLVAFISGAIGCFLSGTFGDLSRALGVFLILLLRRASFGAFSIQIAKQLRASMALSARQPFPPGENPWRYKPTPGTSEPNFNMTFTLLSVILAGAILGWTVTKPIPLFPSWLGAIGTGGALGYFATLRDGKGDLFRFLGWSLSEGVSEISAAAGEVGLTDKGGVVFANALAYGSKLDGKYKIIEKCQTAFAIVLGAVTSTVAKVRSDMEEEENTGRGDGGRGGGGRGGGGGGGRGKTRGGVDDTMNPPDDFNNGNLYREANRPPSNVQRQGGWEDQQTYANSYNTNR